MTKRLLLTLFLLVSICYSQQRVDPRNTYHRLLCVVPLVGAGTDPDPKRPDHAPLPVPGARPGTSGIIAYSYQASDDGQSALVEFVARDRSAFQEILADARPNVKVFEKGKDRREAIEQEFRKHKKNFHLDQFGTIVPGKPACSSESSCCRARCQERISITTRII